MTPPLEHWCTKQPTICPWSHFPFHPLWLAIVKRMQEKSSPRLTPFMMHCALIIKYAISRQVYHIAVREMPALRHKTSSCHQRYYSKAAGCALNWHCYWHRRWSILDCTPRLLLFRDMHSSESQSHLMIS